MKRMLRIVSLVVTGALLLSSCAQNPSAPQVTPIISTPAPMDAIQAYESSRLTIALCGDIGPLHPLRSRETDARSLMGLIYESLIEIDGKGELQAGLASSWTADESGLTWTMNLRPGVHWHCGGTFKAQDVTQTLDLIRQIGEEGPYYHVVQALSSWKAVDDSTLKLTFKELSYAGLYLLDFPVLPGSVGYEKEEAPKLLPGSGPYMVQDLPEDGILLARNDLWWKVPPQIESIQAIYYRNLEAATSALSLRQVDAVETSSLTTDQYKYGNDATVFEYNTGNLEMLFFNPDNYILQNRYIRQAISYALDRSSLAESAYVRHAVVVDTPVAPGSSLYEGTTLKYVYDPQQAKRLIGRTGWKDKDEDGTLDTAPSGTQQILTLRLVTSDSSQREDAAQTIARQLRDVGFEVELSVLPWAQYLKALESKEYDLALGGARLDQAPEYSRLLGTGGSLNLSGYSHEEMDNALAAVKSAATWEELHQATQKVRSLYLTEVPMLCLYYRTQSLLVTSHVYGISYARQGDVYCDISNWKLDRKRN